MDMIARKKKIMMMLQEQESGVGIFTKQYEATLTPQAANSFVITHNMGILPRFCIIEIDDSTRQRTNGYISQSMIDFNVIGMTHDRTGHSSYWFYYNGWANTGILIPSAYTNRYIEYDETSITITGYPYGTSRSQWDTNADYNVRVLG